MFPEDLFYNVPRYGASSDGDKLLYDEDVDTDIGMKDLYFCPCSPSITKPFLLMGYCKRSHKLKASLPFVSHSKSKKIQILILVPSPINPPLLNLSFLWFHNGKKAEKS